jgi:hypothetical protein
LAGTNTVNYITAAFGHKKYMQAAARLERNLLKMRWNNKLTIYDEIKLYEIYPSYESLFVKNHIVGFGAWIWKPLIIQNELRELKENDILVYLDVGCEVSYISRAIEKLMEYINLSKEKGIVVFENGQLEKKYTHNKVYSFFSYNPIHVEDDIQISASVIIISNNDLSRRIIDEWCSACLYNNGILAFNGTVIKPAVAHRNDQSILSVLLKSTKQGLILPNESYFTTEEYLVKHEPYFYPFHTTRNFTEWRFIEIYKFFNNTMGFLHFRVRLLAIRFLTYIMVRLTLLKIKLL